MRSTPYLRTKRMTNSSNNTSKEINTIQFIICRAKQLTKLKQLKEGDIFGSMTEISRNDFMAEVTDASKKYPVLVYLYQTR